MQYINTNRKLGLSGLMRVKNDAQTLSQSIDSCVDALDELIITYHECTDESVQIIERKKLQYPEKILVIPYPYHIKGGYGTTVEEYEYAKTLPIGHPQLLATYYNNALQYVNYKYVMKIDADQIYFTEALKKLRDSIVNGVNQNGLARQCGKLVYLFCQKRGTKRLWSKWHLVHWLQYIVVPMFRKQYVDYAVSELLKGKGYLSLSGVNVLRYNNRWYSPVTFSPYNGFGDHVVFVADEKTEFFPFDCRPSSGKRTLMDSRKNVLIEYLDYPKQKNIYLLGFYWFHLKAMKDDRFVSDLTMHTDELLPVDHLGNVSFNRLLSLMDKSRDDYFIKRNFHNFVHNLDKKSIKGKSAILDCLFAQ